MGRRLSTPLVLLLFVVLFSGCTDPGSRKEQQEWQSVLGVKAQMTANPTTETKQAYADAVAGFLQLHPEHMRARHAWEELQLKRARSLAAEGRYREAAPFYRSFLARHPARDDVQRELDEALRHVHVSRGQLLDLRTGMTTEEVAAEIGKPLPGWKRTVEKNGGTIESWYYGRTDGKVAAVFFRDGHLFAAEYEGPLKLAAGSEE
ncbi:MAG: hypothetical protein WBX15_01825 [Thermoanaerobaculia bacterium]